MSPSHKRFPCPSWRCLYCLWCLVVWIPNYLTRSWSSLVWTGRYQSIEVFSASVVASVGNDSIGEHPAICIECLGWLCIEKYIQANQTVLIALHTCWFFFLQIMWQIENMRLREIFFFYMQTILYLGWAEFPSKSFIKCRTIYHNKKGGGKWISNKHQ